MITLPEGKHPVLINGTMFIVVVRRDRQATFTRVPERQAATLIPVLISEG